MGYTHYWTQTKNHTRAEWTQICEDIGAILKDVQHVQGIPLAFECDEPLKAVEIGPEVIRFNGLGEDGHETFYITRNRKPLEEWQTKDQLGWDFCKTARKPYDLAVTACLAYLAAMESKPWRVSSDGDGRDWIDGVELARRVVNRLGNVIDVPMSIMQDDRWDYRNRVTGTVYAKNYDVNTCLDGAVYVYDVRNESRAYRFPTVDEAKAHFSKFRERPITVRGSDEGGGSLFNAWGAFDHKRTQALARAQDRVLKDLVEAAPILGRNQPPPRFARPLVMPAQAREQASLSELFALAS